VPLALDTGLVAHDVPKNNSKLTSLLTRINGMYFGVNASIFIVKLKEFMYSLLFCTYRFKNPFFLRWKWYNPENRNGEVLTLKNFEVAGGRDRGFRIHL
jgi:hypothetical protein